MKNSPHEEKDERLEAKALKSLKEWAQSQKAELSTDDKATPNEACLAVNRVLMKWGRFIGQDIGFNIQIVNSERRTK